jgi:hypothetical protein
LVQSSGAQIKIELSPVLRGSVFPPVVMSVSELVEEWFGFAEIQVLTLPDLYGGKICAALDRQHPRDLFDVKLLLENEGIDRQIMNAFIVYLISHNRPIRELLSPQLKELTDIYIKHFQGMSEIPVGAEELASARDSMIKTIHEQMTRNDKDFLLSFKSGDPDWSLLNLDGIDQLPAVKWKLINNSKKVVGTFIGTKKSAVPDAPMRRECLRRFPAFCLTYYELPQGQNQPEAPSRMPR